METDIKIIKTKSLHRKYLSEVSRLMEKTKRSHKENDRLELLALVISDYEKKVFPIDRPTPIEAIKFRMEQQGLKPKDMIPYFGHKSKTSEVLAGKRGLTLGMIRELHIGLDISLGILFQKPIK